MNALDQYFKDSGDNIHQLAKRAGLAPSTITRPLSGKRNVSMDTARAIERATGGKVSAAAFITICLEAAKPIQTPRRPRPTPAEKVA